MRADARAVPGGGDAHDLAVALEPVLRGATDDRLGPIEYFRSSWQRGGAATGYATWRARDGREVPVVVKLPVGPVEHRWTSALGDAGTPDDEAWWSPEAGASPTPRVVAHGRELGGYDLAWLVVERLEHPLAGHLSEPELRGLIKTTFEFQRRATAMAEAGGRPAPPDWARLIEKGREACRVASLAEAHRWNDALKRVQKALPTLAGIWDARPLTGWCHGDVHPGNAMHRPGGACVLIDLALVHAGHWVEDAVYLERQFWGHQEMLHGVKPVSELARLRREAGLAGDGPYADIANARRVLAAASAPALIEREGNPKYLHAALETIERVLPQVIHH